MTPHLSAKTLASASKEALVPLYDRSKISAGIVHLGVGNFHRAHQAYYVDKCLSAGQTEWGIIGASLQRPDTRDALASQDFLYSVCISESDNQSVEVVGSILDILVASSQPNELMDALIAPSTRIVTLTVTEKAYLRGSDGKLDLSNASIKSDIEGLTAPKTLHGILTQAIEKRKSAGIEPFTILSCDNLPDNGKTLRSVLLAFASEKNADLAQYIESSIAFPSSMVDRIVPATTDADRESVLAKLGLIDNWPVMTERFTQWVVEDHFPSGRPDWEQFGVQMVSDVAPFELMKLRLLNGAHSSLAYLGQLLGYTYVAEAMTDVNIRTYIQKLWSQTIPTLPQNAGLNPAPYIEQLAARFDNTALFHRTAQIANDGSQKLPQRILGSVSDRLKTNDETSAFSFSIAVWIEALRQREGNTFTDPFDDQLKNLIASYPCDITFVDAIFALTGFNDIINGNNAFKADVASHLNILSQQGANAALANILGKE